MEKTYLVRLRERGQLTLPQAVRESLSLETGDVLTVLQVEDVVVIAPRQTSLSKLAQEFSAIMDEEGVSLPDLLQGLDDERAQIWQERYGRNP